MLGMKIFEEGKNRFKTEAALIVSYLEFLIMVRDEDSKSGSTLYVHKSYVSSTPEARALFEDAVGMFSPSEARPIWEAWSQFQSQYGDFKSILDLDDRMTVIYPNGTLRFVLGPVPEPSTRLADNRLKRFANRQKKHSSDAIAAHDLGFSIVQRRQAR